MKTTIKGILIGAMLLVVTGQVFAYPPDNAAVLYYKDFMLLEEPNDTVKNMLSDLSKGNIGLNEQIKQYVARNHKVIKEIVTAAEIKNCDWGLNLSEGFDLRLPHVGKCRDVAYLLIADAKELAEKGDYKTALERCITIHKMGIHIGGDVLIQQLVGSAIGGLADRRIAEILPQVSNDTETLQWLRVQLADVSNRYHSIEVAIGNEIAILNSTTILNSVNKEVILEAVEGVRNLGPSKDNLDKAKKVIRLHDDKEFYVRATEYYKLIIPRIQIAYGLPFPQAKQALGDLCKEVENTTKEKPEAVIAEVLLPMFNQALMKDTRNKTHLNAVIAGIEIYIIRAKTGKLPDELPAGLPKDMFSGKDFLYEKADAGFILNGQGKDLDKDIVQKYEFKVAK
jgi:hypothetical protein